MAQKPQARRDFPPAEILAGLSGGLDTYTTPTQAPWQRWLASNNVFSGAFGFVQRARWANVVTNTQPGYFPSGSPFTSLRYYALPDNGSFLIADTGGKLWSFN